MSTPAQIKRASARARQEMNRLDATALRELTGLYQQAAGEIRARIASSAAADGNIGLAQLQNVLGQVNLALQQLTQQRDGLLNAGLDKAAALGVAPFASAPGAAGSIDAGISAAAQQRIAREALAYVRGFVAADGLQLSDRIWRLDRGAREQLANRIEQAVIQGHSASQAAAELLGQGQPVPAGVQAKMGDGNAQQLAKAAGALLTQGGAGDGSPMRNAMRVFRTELNRAHGTAYLQSLDYLREESFKRNRDRAGQFEVDLAKGLLDIAGTKFLLSPAHPEPDICDLLAAQNLYGLGKGVYPLGKTPWPAHPNTLSYVEVVFADQVKDEDRAGKETPLQALQRLTPEQRIGVLGRGKATIYDAGRLTQGMIRAPLGRVQERLGQTAARPVPAPPAPPPAVTSDAMSTKGRERIAKAVQEVVGSASARAPWGKFPPVNILTTLRDLPLGGIKFHPLYKAAKGGDAAAAYRLITEIEARAAKPWVESVRAMLGDARPAVVPVQGADSPEGVRTNALPGALALVLADRLGLPIDRGIIKVSTFRRTDFTGWQRLALPPRFEGRLAAPARGVLLADDALTQGGTLAGERGWIEGLGAHVFGAVALTGRPISATLAIQPATLRAVRGRYAEIERWCIATLGYGFDRFTESEARYLLEYGAGPNAVRNRLAQARREAGK